MGYTTGKLVGNPNEFGVCERAGEEGKNMCG